MNEGTAGQRPESSGGVSPGSSSPVSISDALSSVNINIPDVSGAAASAVTGMEGAMVDISV